MANGLTRLADALPRRRPTRVDDAARARRGAVRRRASADEAGLVTVAPDEIDWDDEVRLAIEERASLSPDALTGMEANLRFAGPETMETKIFGRLSAWQNWIFPRPNADRRARRADALRQARAPAASTGGGREMIDRRSPNEKIPNNVDLVVGQAPAARARAVAAQLPRLVEARWAPRASRSDDVYLRTAIRVETDGWAHFDYVKMPDYRWGIFLDAARAGPHASASATAWASRCGRRCPASTATRCAASSSPRATPSRRRVEQQRLLGQTAPSLYDLRNLFQVNVEEGRHLWAMVYLLHTLLRPRRPRGGRGAARSAASGDPDKPRILGAFNEPIDDWLDFFMFTMFTDRDGKYQLLALAESRASIRSRAPRRFMLTEEAHHMFVGETGVEPRRRSARAELMKQDPNERRARAGRHRPADASRST